MNRELASELLRAALNVEPGVWFFLAFTCLMAYGYLDIISRVRDMF